MKTLVILLVVALSCSMFFVAWTDQGTGRFNRIGDNIGAGWEESSAPEFARAADGLPIVDGSRQRQPFPIPAFESVSFYVVGDDVQIYYGHCNAEVLPATMQATAEDYLLGIGHIRPTPSQQMTKVTVISSDAHGCGT